MPTPAPTRMPTTGAPTKFPTPAPPATLTYEMELKDESVETFGLAKQAKFRVAIGKVFEISPERLTLVVRDRKSSNRRLQDSDSGNIVIEVVVESDDIAEAETFANAVKSMDFLPAVLAASSSEGLSISESQLTVDFETVYLTVITSAPTPVPVSKPSNADNDEKETSPMTKAAVGLIALTFLAFCCTDSVVGALVGLCLRRKAQVSPHAPDKAIPYARGTCKKLRLESSNSSSSSKAKVKSSAVPRTRSKKKRSSTRPAAAPTSTNEGGKTKSRINNRPKLAPLKPDKKPSASNARISPRSRSRGRGRGKLPQPALPHAGNISPRAPQVSF